MGGELIPIREANFGFGKANAINARDLHAYLESQMEFSMWWKYQVNRARLKEGRDFLRVDGEYYLTLDAAKHVAMMSNTEKGFEAREYFIECERLASNPARALAKDVTIEDMARAVLDISSEKKALEAKVGEMEVKVDALDRIATSDGSFCLRDAAKAIQWRQNDFIFWLRSHKWIFLQGGVGDWKAYSERLQSGVLVHKITIVPTRDGVEKSVAQVRVTPLGMATLAKHFSSEPFRLRPGGAA